MKPIIYSIKKSEEKQIGWHPFCDNISYFPNGLLKFPKSAKSLYTLRFSYTFEYNQDNVYFAYNYPYTYSQLTEYLDKLELDTRLSDYVSRRTLCRTLLGNRCEYLTITSASEKSELTKNTKKGVCITARVHPGETVGSWMMQGIFSKYENLLGIMEFLTDPDNKEAQVLRDNFVFKLVPILNPDGVINGNYRCGLAGCDLNRRWKKPTKVFL